MVVCCVCAIYSRVCSVASVRHRLAQRRAQQPIRIVRAHCSPASTRRMSSASASDHALVHMRHWVHGDDSSSHPLSPPAAPFVTVIACLAHIDGGVNVGLISVCPSAADARLDAGAHDWAHRHGAATRTIRSTPPSTVTTCPPPPPPTTVGCSDCYSRLSHPLVVGDGARGLWYQARCCKTASCHRAARR